MTLRRTPMRRRRSTPRRRTAPQAGTTGAETSHEWWEAATLALLRRSGHRCEKCGHPLNGQLERHHRQRRRVGGDRLSNLLALHTVCHQWITEHPTDALAAGWIVSSHAPDPAAVPVRLPGADWWLLDDDGGKVRCPIDQLPE